LKHYPLDPLKDDPGYTQCEPWGLARQMFAPHQFEVRRQGKDRIELRYGEWAAKRTVYMDGRSIPANIKSSRLGYSVGRWDGDTRQTIVTTVLTQLRFVSPHAKMYLDAKDASGKVEKWVVEFDGRLNLSNFGWTADSIKSGEHVIVTGNPSHTEPKRIFFIKL